MSGEAEGLLPDDVESAVERVQQVDSETVLDAILELEVGRRSGDDRKSIVGAINQRKEEVEEQCPRGCDAPVLDRFETADAFQIKHQNAVQHKTCITLVERLDGGSSLVVVFHDEPGPTEDLGEPMGQSKKRLFHKMKSADGTMNLAGIKGWCSNELDLSPDEARLKIDTLENDGYIEEIDNGVYACPPRGGE